jgi:hypothetical protein
MAAPSAKKPTAKLDVGVWLGECPTTGAPGPWVTLVYGEQRIGLTTPEAREHARRILDACDQVENEAVGKAMKAALQ